jgi:hypothetical protein
VSTRTADDIVREAADLAGRAAELHALERAGVVDAEFAAERRALIAAVSVALAEEMRRAWFAAHRDANLAALAALDGEGAR